MLEIFRRTYRDTVAYYRWPLIAAHVALFGIGCVAHTYREGYDKMWEEFGIWVSYTLVPGLVLWAIVFLWNFALAPLRIERDAHAETRKKIESGEEALAKATATIERLNARLARPKPDYGKWDEVEQFRLHEAACLWVEEEPTSRTGEMSESAKAQFCVLRKAIEGKQLSFTGSLDEIIRISSHIVASHLSDAYDTINTNTSVYRSGLEKLAKSTNQRPKFLFLGARP